MGYLKYLILLVILHFNFINSEIIIFDLFQVLFDWSTEYREKFKISEETKKKYLDILKQVKINSIANQNFKLIRSMQISEKNRVKIFYAYQTGKISSKKAFLKILTTIKEVDDNFFDHLNQKKEIIKAAKLDFDINKRKKLFFPIPEGISLLKRCGEQKDPSGNFRHKLYLLSNVENEMIEYLIEKYPDIFSLFEGIMTSAHAGYMKPEPEIYQKLLITYNLRPGDCTFIDDQQANIDAAKKLNMNGIICKSFSGVSKILEQKQLLSAVS